MSATKINIIGYGYVVPENFSVQENLEPAIFNVKPYLKDRKSFKFLSKQDALALTAASKAWEPVKTKNIGERTGIYFCVGTLPFEDKPLDTLCEKSQKNGKLDFDRFSTDAFHALNPLLTFKCLPNMPLYHISYNLEVTGTYFVTYPGVTEWFLALERAICDLQDNLIDYAIVGAVADQDNFLVKHHMARVFPHMTKRLVDSAAAIVITNQEFDHAIAQVTHIGIDIAQHKTSCNQNSSAIQVHTGCVETCLALAYYLEQKPTHTFIYKTHNEKTKLTLQVEQI